MGHARVLVWAGVGRVLRWMMTVVLADSLLSPSAQEENILRVLIESKQGTLERDREYITLLKVGRAL